MTEAKPIYHSTGEQLDKDTILELHRRLMEIRRDAISIVHMAENVLRLPPEQRAFQERRKRRQSSRIIDRGHNKR